MGSGRHAVEQRRLETTGIMETGRQTRRPRRRRPAPARPSHRTPAGGRGLGAERHLHETRSPILGSFIHRAEVSRGAPGCQVPGRQTSPSEKNRRAREIVKTVEIRQTRGTSKEAVGRQKSAGVG